MRRGSLGSIHRMWQSPWGTRMRENDLPPSTERHVPRFRTYMVFSSVGSAATDEKYHGRTMNFWSALTRSQLAPASSGRKMPPLQSTAGPSPLGPTPAEKPQGNRWLFHMAANSTRGFVASRARSIAPVESSTYSTLLQLRPPSVDRNTPRVALGPKACPIAATYTTSGLAGSTRTAAM